MTERLSTGEKLEELRHEWRQYPHFVDSIARAGDVLKNPQDYIVKTGVAFDEERPLLEVTGRGNRPLIGIKYLYDLLLKDSAPRHTLLQIHFQFSEPRSLPDPSRFRITTDILSGFIDPETHCTRINRTNRSKDSAAVSADTACCRFSVPRVGT